ncbi:MAG: UDP-N-acetylmuramoyl-L-alanyl-D-glutamate--2,6-diaminopimelate ligase [Clostridiaceae bacterium]|jgi:UDP-N-acetylmuramoyl-L-alanyl-D-glutamate--2,6-diaminopimelate ligase|nr:UDP-N-acetylmuramoyl-L-alanyl-D-glutamate--2,6-diaminopimelate ligase [Clostridiaceae bacterium]
MQKEPASPEKQASLSHPLTDDTKITDCDLGDLSIRVSLVSLLKTITFNVFQGDFEKWRDFLVTDIISDSRKARDGTLFLAISGIKTDGHLYVRDAYDCGCRIFVTERPVELPEGCLVLGVHNTTSAQNALVRRFFGYPERELLLIGITGTKGKTTIVHMLYDALMACGMEAATIGTTGVRHRDFHRDLVNTTPDMNVLTRYFYLLRRRGVNVVAMEVSSSALKGQRVDGLLFEYAVCTNIGYDHISPIEHSDFNDYRESKAKLFSMANTSILNFDDPSYTYMKAHAAGKTISYSLQPSSGADIWAVDLHHSYEEGKGASSSFTAHGLEESDVMISAPGDHNVANALAVIAVMHQMGFQPNQYRDALRSNKIAGRNEFLDTFQGVIMLIDYAHNGMGMRAVLEMLTGLKRENGRLMVLFGAVGGRAKNRRRDLAEAVSQFADVAMVTTDCPYDEDPKSIMDEVLLYMTDFKGELLQEIDRHRAIHQMVDLAREGDIILFAGMGDDNTRTFSGVTVPYSEKAVILEAVEARKARKKSF